MSHAATNWAIQQRGLKPTTKIVLWHLCDRFNPDFGCFPTQERLAHDCEIGRATLNRHLDELEARRLIKRVRIIDTKTGQQRPTRYLLGFEFEDGHGTRPTHLSADSRAATGAGDTASPCPSESTPSTCQNTTETPCLDLGHGHDAETPCGDEDQSPSAPAPPCLETGHGPASHFGQNPCLKNGVSRVSKWDTNLVREPLREPVKEEEGADARENAVDDFFGTLLEALGFAPAIPLPGWWQGWPPREHVRRWQAELGLSEAEIVATARASRREHPEPPDGPKALDRVMARAAQRKTGSTAKKPGSRSKAATEAIGAAARADVSAFYADWVNSDKYLPPSAITNTIRDQMLARELVTAQRLRERGIH